MASILKLQNAGESMTFPYMLNKSFFLGVSFAGFASQKLLWERGFSCEAHTNDYLSDRKTKRTVKLVGVVHLTDSDVWVCLNVTSAGF